MSRTGTRFGFDAAGSLPSPVAALKKNRAQPRLWSSSIAEVLFALFLLSLFLTPNINALSGVPAFRLEDLLTYLMILILLAGTSRPPLNRARQRYLFISVALLFWMTLSIAVNGRMFEVSDDFELFKLLKFMVIFLFCSHHVQSVSQWSRVVTAAFIGVAVVNLLNLTNWYQFNDWAMPYFAGTQLEAFREDLRQGGGRILGTMGNPNNNAIVLSFFALFFIVTGKGLRRYLVFIPALVLMTLSQSRTTFVGFFAVTGTFILLRRRGVRRFSSVLAIGGLVLAIAAVLNLDYLSSLWTSDIANTASIVVRLDIWWRLLDMVQASPWMGYGPFKDYFYSRGLHADNEYILMLWRYGYPGLVIYLLWAYGPVVAAVRMGPQQSATLFAMFGMLLAICGLTNAPLAEPRIAELFAALCGVALRRNDGVDPSDQATRAI